ncbi:PREDICTED: endogenous retrovirus group K member 9 Pol protein-like isoform X1 [Corvus brachyrhynchos]|uniref:endogenous retrovirus group K member 9 Pol protein-like isoform X1 n=1 Tax=Corvus brachyrhynchos TaxID=85066 RepID=UPI00081673B7|nr:PREDICTED: endogenous retrovirus group K member 9 Pol protein-like isoform X1 [Corvus brachyrhynchos]
MAVPMKAATSQAALPGVALAATAPAAAPHAGVVPASCQPPGRPSDAPLPDDASSVAMDTPASLRESVKALRRQQPVTRLARNRPRTFPECKSCVPRAEQRSHGDGGFGSRGLLQVFWTADISSQKPQVMCNLILPNAQPPKILLQGLIDTGADMTVVSFSAWPPRWPLAPAGSAITGLGRTAKSYLSEQRVLVKNAEGQTATVRPYVTAAPLNLWGWDVLAAWGVRIGTNF